MGTFVVFLLKLVNFLHFPAGFEFFQSANGVILCEGDENGRLPAELFAKVVHRKKGKAFLKPIFFRKCTHNGTLNPKMDS